MHTKEEIKEQDLNIILKTRDAFHQAFIEERNNDPERFGELTYEQFEKLYMGYMIQGIKKAAENHCISIDEIIEEF